MTELSPDAVPKFRRGIARKFDAARQQHVLLGPERVILLDEIGNAIAEHCDGKASIAQIAAGLAARYQAPLAQVQPDVAEFIGELLEKNLVTL